ncbi:MAG: hypothetical protein NZ551_02875 [Microscillaceae bacterium]|nr:hypothetical protein [Microscillaceae bacterium]MDW8460131.1 hypothetical protein [Cytophagales bacterium]
MIKQLDKDWLTQGLIDFEYKKYILLAYLQEVRKCFSQIQLYPYLSDLVFHYQNLVDLRQNKQLALDKFPKHLSQTDLENLQFKYSQIVQDDALMEELESIISFALPQFKTLLNEGRDIYEWIETNLEISPVGLTPLRFEEGYLLLSENQVKEMQIYQYQISIFENANEKYRGVHTFFLETVVRNLGQTLENIKIELLRRHKQLPNPATYWINAKVTCPREETLLPIAKRLLVKYIATHT